MLKKRLMILLALLIVCTSFHLRGVAEGEPALLILTDEMEFFSGPGTQYAQTAFHNTPPQPGEAAEIIGRVAGENGQDWLFVRYTGHWFSQTHTVQYYLPVSAAPEFANAPLLTFTSEPNTLAVETANIYANPEGTNYDGYITPTDAGVTVLDVQGTTAYIEAVNPYGVLRRGYINTRDLTQQPGAASIPDAPAGTAVRISAADVTLAHRPAYDYAQVLPLADGTLALRYGSIPEDAPWGEALAVISPDGKLLANTLYRTHDGMEESTVEFLLTSSVGFRVCRYVSDDLTPIREEHYTPDGTYARTDVRRYSDGAPRPMMGTTHFTVSLGRTAYAGETDAGPLQVTALGGASIQLNIDPHASIPEIAECSGMLIVPVSSPEGQRLLIFSQTALLCEIAPSEPLFIHDMQAVPTSDQRIAMLLGDGSEGWQIWLLDVRLGTITPGPAFTAPYNRRVTLLSADESQALVAISGLRTQLILVNGQGQQLAGSADGTVLHAQTDGSVASLLLIEEGVLHLESWTLTLP